MKKITLLLLAFILSYSLHAQETISFESSEGYSLGDINGQNGWITTGTGPGTFISNQVISNEQSTDGDWSLKLTTEGAFPGQENLIVGAFYQYETDVDYTDATFSFDVYIEQVMDGNDYRFALLGEGVNDQGEPGLFFISIVDFTFDNDINVVNNSLNFEVIGTWAPNTWYNVKVEITGSQAEYFIDDTSFGTYDLINNLDITEARFVHDNFGGSAFIDNFKTNDETMSIGSFLSENSFVHFVNNNSLSMQSSALLNEVEIFNLAGKRVIIENLNNQNDVQIDINALNHGIYIAKLNTDNGVHSFKFSK